MKLIPRKRRKEGVTNYTKRKALLEGKKPRVVIRKTNKYILIQYVTSSEAQDYVKASVSSRELLEHGWPAEKNGSLKSLAAAYLTGMLFASKVKKFEKAILDTGLVRSTKGSRIYSAVKGIKDNGFDIPCSSEVFLKEEQIVNENTKPFFEKIKKSLGAK